MSDSDSDDDNVIRYGTPLEPYEEDEVPSKRKFQPAEQYATDAHGRRRFHGAFTGGFSAGFGNTVGSQEGWTPATFKSSRSEKATASSQRPEDYMDEEDRSEYGIAPRQLTTHSEFSGQKRPLRTAYHDGPIPGAPVLDQLLRPVHETAAVKMLKAMGWRPGQGTGDRLTREQKKKAKDRQRVYGCYMPPEFKKETDQPDSDSSDSEYDIETLFAPDDYEPYILSPKSDKFGLGYQGLSRHSVLGNLVGEYGSDAGSSKSHLVMKDKGKKVSIRGQAFGVGAFEADDEDIYAREDMSHYDFTLGGPTEIKDKKRTRQEGRVLPGFVRGAAPLPPVPSYPPPALPRDYEPAPAGTRRSRFEPTTAPQRDQGLGRHELTAEARGNLLGEEPLPKPPASPPKTTTQPTPEDIIAKITGRNVNFVTTDKTENETPDFISIKDSGKELKNVFKPFAANPLKQKRYERFLEGDEARDGEGDKDRVTEWERERELLEFSQAAKLYRPLTGVMGDRFTHASQPDDAVNPLTAVAKSSNTYGLATAEQIEAAAKGVYGVMTRTKVSWRPESLVCKRFNVPEPGVTRSEPKKADKPKISYSVFSYLETSVHDKETFAKEQTTFSGSKSVNVTEKSNKNIPSTENTGKNIDIPINSITFTQNSNIITNTQNIQNNVDTIKQTDKQTDIPTKLITQSDVPKRMTVAELFLKESEKKKAQGEEVTETIDKFDKMDLYKSIFLSDSEEEEEDKEKNTSEAKSDEFSVFDSNNSFVEKPKNVLRNTSPPRGIFANIDFDEINSWKRIEIATTDKGKDVDKDKEKGIDKANIDKKIQTNDKNKDNRVSEEMETDVYGPKIPENLAKKIESSSSTIKFNSSIKFNSKKNSTNEEIVHEIDSSSDSWVDANQLKSKKKKKKTKHKKDKSKHKDKKKHKKKDR